MALDPITVLDFTEITDIQETDILYSIRGVGLDRDKKIQLVNVLKNNQRFVNPIGATFTTASSVLALSMLTETQAVALIGTGIQAYDWDGDSWATAGNLFASAWGGSASVSALTNQRIAVLDATGGVLQAYDFNGTTWSTVGSSIVTGPSLGLVAINSTQVVLFQTAGTDHLNVYEFNGSTWSAVGTNLNIANTANHSIALLKSDGTDVIIALCYVDAADSNKHKIQAYTWDGSDFTATGNAYEIGTTGFTTNYATGLTSFRILLTYSGGGQVLDFDGTDWTIAGTICGALASNKIVSVSSSIIANGAGADLEMFFSVPESRFTLPSAVI